MGSGVVSLPICPFLVNKPPIDNAPDVVFKSSYLTLLIKKTRPTFTPITGNQMQTFFETCETCPNGKQDGLKSQESYVYKYSVTYSSQAVNSTTPLSYK